MPLAHPGRLLHPRRLLHLGLACLALLGLSAGCRVEAEGSQPLVVFAAASLGAPFEELARQFEEENPGEEVLVHTAGTPQLLLQLRQGARADVLATADLESLDSLRASGMELQPTVFARNHLAILTQEGNPHALAGPSDLQDPELRVLLCGPEVPAGRYARAALERAGVVPRSLSDEPSVRALTAKLSLGEVDAAIAYVTDVRAGLEALPLAPELDPGIAYPICVLGEAPSLAPSVAPSVARARAFVDHVLSSAGQSVLRRHGFLQP